MRSRDKTILTLVLALTLPLGCVKRTAAHTYALSLLAADADGSPAAYARVILDGVERTCPTLEKNDGTSVKTSARVNPAKDDFPVTVCEAEIDFGATYRVPGGLSISGGNLTPSRILVYGDTGCDSKPEHCAQQSTWPFPTLAAKGAGADADLILHMGDYNYRGTKGSIHLGDLKLEVYDAGDHYPSDPDCSLARPYYSENASDNPQSADTWANWQADFFTAAGDLLSAAPWVLTRGNHELCSRAGVGWFYLLDAGSNLPGAANPQRECPSQGSILEPDTDVLSHVVFIEPFVVELDNLAVAVMDSANACDNFAPTATTTIYATQFALLQQLIADDNPAWLMTHRPIWGVTDGLTTGAVQSVNQTLQQALELYPPGGLPSAVELSFSGHMHRYQSSASIDGSRPPQIVIGNSGVKLADPEAFGTCFDLFDSCGNNAAKFGFLQADTVKEGDWSSWSGEILEPDGKTLATCGTTVLPGSICAQTSTPCGCSP